MGTYILTYLLTQNHINSTVVSLIATLSLDLLFKRTEGLWNGRPGGSLDVAPFPFSNQNEVNPCSADDNQSDCENPDIHGEGGCVWTDDNRCVAPEGFKGHLVEGFKNSYKKKRRRKRETFKADNDDQVNEDYIDLGSSFLEAYKSLSPKAIEGMTTDTKTLIDTQNKLMDQLNSMGPLLKGGKKIMEQFKHYFDDEL